MSSDNSSSNDWPAIPYKEWQDTASALHLYLQIVGKYRLACSPWVNHAWHATFYPTPRGLATSMIPDGDGGIEIEFDFVDHALYGVRGSGAPQGLQLEPMSVADFHDRFVRMIVNLGGDATFHGSPNEVENPIPFESDTASRPYDADAVARFHRALKTVSRVFQEFRTGFRGKVSPIHLFWGSLDLAVTRFSGKRAPLHPGGILNLPDDVTQEAYSHEVSSAGFWAGGGPVDDAAFYSYAYPTPKGFAGSLVEPAAAYFDNDFGEFILPYEAVRLSADPESTLLAFLESSYAAAASLGNWDRSQECTRGLRGKPLPIN